MVSLEDWRNLGEPELTPAQVRLRSATGNDMGVAGSFCGTWMVWQAIGGADSSGGDSSSKVPVFSDETGECWL